MAIHMEKHKTESLPRTTCSYKFQTDLTLFLEENIREISLCIYDYIEISKKPNLLYDKRHHIPSKKMCHRWGGNIWNSQN